MTEKKLLNATWWLLLGATALTFWLGEWGGNGALGAWSAGYQRTSVAMVALGVITALKGLAITQVYLEMRHAPLLWRCVVLGWLLVVLTLIAVAYALAGRAG